MPKIGLENLQQNVVNKINSIGDVNQLETENKDSVVDAINEILQGNRDELINKMNQYDKDYADLMREMLANVAIETTGEETLAELIELVENVVYDEANIQTAFMNLLAESIGAPVVASDNITTACGKIDTITQEVNNQVDLLKVEPSTRDKSLDGQMQRLNPLIITVA